MYRNLIIIATNLFSSYQVQKTLFKEGYSWVGLKDGTLFNCYDALDIDETRTVYIYTNEHGKITWSPELAEGERAITLAQASHVLKSETTVAVLCSMEEEF